MGTIASQITSLTIVYSIVYSDADQRKHQSSASMAFMREIHRGPVNSPHKWPVTRKMFPFGDVIMVCIVVSEFWGSYINDMHALIHFQCPVQLVLNILRPWRNGHHFRHDFFKCIFLNQNLWISIKISLKFVPRGSINNIPATVQMMACRRRPGDKPYLNLLWLDYRLIYASFGLNELPHWDRGKWPPFCWRHFRMPLSDQKLL